jgi:hypothetical protein
MGYRTGGTRMNYRMAIVGVILLVGMGTTTSANAGVSNVQIVNGTCTSASHTAEGPLGIDLTKRQSRFYCNVAAITFFDDSPGHILINFSEKEAQHSPALGFAGRIEASDPRDVGTMMRVSNVYLASGQATPVSDGWCKIFLKGEQLSGIGCGMKVEDAGRETVAIVTFNVSPGQSLQVVAPPDLAGESKIETLPDGTKIVTLPNGNKVETLVDGTVWAVIYPNNTMLAIQLDPNSMPTDSGFRTVMIVNLPESDIVNAPRSERIQIQGECQSRTYQIMGALPYSGKNGGGLPDVGLAATEPEGVLRKVMPDTPVWHAFELACKKHLSN